VRLVGFINKKVGTIFDYSRFPQRLSKTCTYFRHDNRNRADTQVCSAQHNLHGSTMQLDKYLRIHLQHPVQAVYGLPFSVFLISL